MTLNSDILLQPAMIEREHDPSSCLQERRDCSHTAVEAAFADMMSFVPVTVAARHDLWQRMTGPERHYHNANHLKDLWQLHCKLGDAAGFGSRRSTVLIASAIAFHDVIYDTGRRDNEERSAELWLKASFDGAMHDIDRLWVADAIRATADHLAVENQPCGDLPIRLRQWFLDLDLASLGAAPKAFKDNTHLLRMEAASLPDDIWQSSLVGFMSRLSASPSIYRSATIRDLFEEQARINIHACLVRVG